MLGLAVSESFLLKKSRNGPDKLFCSKILVQVFWHETSPLERQVSLPGHRCLGKKGEGGEGGGGENFKMALLATEHQAETGGRTGAGRKRLQSPADWSQ